MPTIAELIVKIGADTKELKASVNAVTSVIKKAGAALGIAFGAQQAVGLIKDMVSLAAKAEGVEAAFSRLNKVGLLSDLQKATKGTVSDLELMQRAVQANNFKIPLENLATYFEFARRRAKETGESVDYLVQSIVTGIGRKSPLILDNLGISTIRLQKEFAKTGDFAQAAGNIIRTELSGMGADIDTTAEKLARFNALWENLKKKAGDAIIDIATGLSSVFGGESNFLMSDLEEAAKLTKKSLDGLFSTVRVGRTAFNPLGVELKILNKEGKEAIEILNNYRKAQEHIANSAAAYKQRQLEAAYASEQAGNAMQKILPIQTQLMRVNDALTLSIEKVNYAWSLNAATLGTAIKNTAIDAYDSVQYLNDVVNGALQNAIVGIGKTLGDLFSGAQADATPLENILGIVAGFMSSLGQALIAVGVASEAFKNALTNPGMAIAAGVALVALSSVVRNMLSAGPGEEAEGGGATDSSFKSTPRLAEGGLAYGPTLAVVGDNPGPNPEVIAPLDKLQGMIGGGMGGEVRFRIEGQELVGVLNRYNNSFNRIKG